MAKRKRSSLAAIAAANTADPMLPPSMIPTKPPQPGGRVPARNPEAIATPNENTQVSDVPTARHASPKENGAVAELDKWEETESPLSDPPPDESPPKKQRKAKMPKTADAAGPTSATPALATTASKKGNAETLDDPEADATEEVGEEEIRQAMSRPPPVNSSYLPLPWKGRLGYACLNTYLRYSHPPVFSSRTCRIASILEHRHPLADQSQPEHPTKNRPDKNKPADIALGQRWVEGLGLQNAKDIVKMLRWNDKFGIKFMRLSSEMFPFASHEEYGYNLAPFASETLAEVGKVVAELGHRVTTHPGQFTQLGSPRKQVVDNAIRDLEYHDEMLTLLKLPPQQDRDAVMILHMGGVFGSKPETIARFKENYAKLSPSIKNRLVLENDDMGWSVHDLLPICQELNIPLVLDYHHHNIVFDATKIREGTKDIMDLYPQIRETWTRKSITQKMHYSEPCPDAVTPRQRRKHSPRVRTLPPCPPDMDLMIEAKDKEQAVFELMRTFKLPGFDKLSDITPYSRGDDNRLLEKNQGRKKSTPKKKRGKAVDDAGDEMDNGVSTGNAGEEQIYVPDEEVGMGGTEGRVYWPPSMEEWLRPKKRELKKKDDDNTVPKPKTPTKRGAKAAAQQRDAKPSTKSGDVRQIVDTTQDLQDGKGATGTRRARARKKTQEKPVPTPSTSDDDVEDMALERGEGQVPAKSRKIRSAPARTSKRTARVSYTEA